MILLPIKGKGMQANEQVRSQGTEFSERVIVNGVAEKFISFFVSSLFFVSVYINFLCNIFQKVYQLK